MVKSSFEIYEDPQHVLTVSLIDKTLDMYPGIFRAFTSLESKLPGRETASKDVHKASALIRVDNRQISRYDSGFVFTLSGNFKRVITHAAFHSLGKYPFFIHDLKRSYK